MRVLICGDRNWDDVESIRTLICGLRELHGPSLVIIEGEARGADLMARMTAESLTVTVERYPADWTAYGRAAGPIRNQQMLTEGKPDTLYAFHDDIDNSKGTKNMVALAMKAGVPVCVVSRGSNKG